MKLLIVSAYFKPHMGGIENYTAQLAAALASKGVEVTVLTSKSDKESPYSETDPAGYRIIRLKSMHFLSERYPLLISSKGKRIFAKNFSENNFDAVIINARYYPISLFASRLAYRYRLPCLLVDHSSSYVMVGNKFADFLIRHYENLITFILKKRGTNFFSVSSDGVAWLSTFGIDASGVFFNAIDAECFANNASGRDFRAELSLEDALVVSFTGRLIKEKGVWTCLELAKKLEGHGYVFLIAGNGPEMAALKRNAPDNLFLLGRLESDDIAALLRQTDVYLFPSTYPEGFPTTLLEAASMGCTIVTTSVSGVNDLMPSDRYGVVLERDSDVCDFAEAILSVENGKCADCGVYVRQRVIENFSWDATAQAIIDYLIGAKPSSANY